MLAQVTPSQLDLLEKLATLPLPVLLLLAICIMGYVIYNLWRRILVLEDKLEQCLDKYNKTP